MPDMVNLVRQASEVLCAACIDLLHRLQMEHRFFYAPLAMLACGDSWVLMDGDLATGGVHCSSLFDVLT
jgi:hypothetical protein